MFKQCQQHLCRRSFSLSFLLLPLPPTPVRTYASLCLPTRQHLQTVYVCSFASTAFVPPFSRVLLSFLTFLSPFQLSSSSLLFPSRFPPLPSPFFSTYVYFPRFFLGFSSHSLRWDASFSRGIHGSLFWPESFSDSGPRLFLSRLSLLSFSVQLLIISLRAPVFSFYFHPVLVCLEIASLVIIYLSVRLSVIVTRVLVCGIFRQVMIFEVLGFLFKFHFYKFRLFQSVSFFIFYLPLIASCFLNVSSFIKRFPQFLSIFLHLTLSTLLLLLPFSRLPVSFIFQVCIFKFSFFDLSKTCQSPRYFNYPLFIQVLVIYPPPSSSSLRPLIVPPRSIPTSRFPVSLCFPFTLPTWRGSSTSPCPVPDSSLHFLTSSRPRPPKPSFSSSVPCPLPLFARPYVCVRHYTVVIQADTYTRKAARVFVSTQDGRRQRSGTICTQSTPRLTLGI